MGFWTNAWNWLNGTPGTPNSLGPADYNPGDPDGLELQGQVTESRSLPWLSPSEWSGWPSGWSTPEFAKEQTAKANKIADVVWAALDLNSNVISSMPVYQTKNGQVIDPETWMTNPDDMVYTCWQEFAKQLFWDFQMGEAFVYPMFHGSDGYPARFRVIPPHLVEVKLGRGGRTYKFGSRDVTDEILHIRYKSTIADMRGRGPLESALPRLVNIELLQRYVGELAKTGGVPLYWMELDRRITQSEGQDLLTIWAENRMKNIGQPALVGSGAKLQQAKTMDAKEMGLLELSQFDESRLSVLLGVPPFLMGLAGASGSLTYSNISDLYDFHDRSSLRPKVRMVMESLSNWALPSGRSVELNRDDYTRLTIDKRYAAYAVGIQAGFLGAEEVRAFERLGPMPQSMLDALAAMQQTGAQNGQAPKQSIPSNNGRQSLTAAKALSGGAN